MHITISPAVREAGFGDTVETASREFEAQLPAQPDRLELEWDVVRDSEGKKYLIVSVGNDELEPERDLFTGDDFTDRRYLADRLATLGSRYLRNRLRNSLRKLDEAFAAATPVGVGD